jgi:hypothetical protein
LFFIITGGIHGGTGRLIPGLRDTAILIGIGVFILSFIVGSGLNALIGGRSFQAIAGVLIGLGITSKVMDGSSGFLFAIALIPPLIYLFDKYNPSLPDPDLQPIASLFQGMIIGAIAKQG